MNSNLRFEVDGVPFRIEFQRDWMKVPYYGEDGEKVGEAIATHPYTTVKLVQLHPETGKPVEVFREATVGCSPYDTYTLESGRRWALRSVTRTLNHLNDADKNAWYKRFKSIMWQTYLTRSAK
jgi:hypothetical protein